MNRTVHFFFITDCADLGSISPMLMDAKDFKHPGITEKIIGCAMRAHSYFGLGFPEIVYQRGV